MPSRAFVLTVSALVSLPACGASVEIEQGASSSSNPLPPVLEPPEPPPALPDPGVRLGQGLQPRCIRSALGTVDCWDTWLGDPDATSPALLAFIGRLDVFTIWVTVLLAIGLSVTGNIPRSRAAIAGQPRHARPAMPGTSIRGSLS